MRDNIRKILSIRDYKAGYRLVKYIVDGTSFGGKDLEMTSSFSLPKLQYIGDSKWAYRLCKTREIIPETIKPQESKYNPNDWQKAKDLLAEDLLKDYDWQVCQIGFQKEEQKWYGWSHRAIYGFEISSKVKKGDLSYSPDNKENLMEDMLNFWGGERNEEGGYEGVTIQALQDVPDPRKEQEGTGILIKTATSFFGKQEGRDSYETTHWDPYPETWGKGDWSAETLEDAKQMAIDFAHGVS